MIQLDIKPYCHDCPNFEVQSVTNKLYCDGKAEYILTRVFCSKEDTCAAIQAYISARLMDKENEEEE